MKVVWVFFMCQAMVEAGHKAKWSVHQYAGQCAKCQTNICVFRSLVQCSFHQTHSRKSRASSDFRPIIYLEHIWQKPQPFCVKTISMSITWTVMSSDEKSFPQAAIYLLIRMGFLWNANSQMPCLRNISIPNNSSSPSSLFPSFSQKSILGLLTTFINRSENQEFLEDQNSH